MQKNLIKQLYMAINTIFNGDYTPEEEILEYDDTYTNDDEYTEAVVNMFLNHPAKWCAYVKGAKEFFPEMYGSEDSMSCLDMEGFKSIYPNEFKVLNDNDFFKI